MPGNRGVPDDSLDAVVDEGMNRGGVVVLEVLDDGIVDDDAGAFTEGDVGHYR